MKKRINTIETLKAIVSKEKLKMVETLEEDIEEFFYKLDIYNHYNRNIPLYKAMYKENKTNLKISLDIHLDLKRVTEFHKRTEEFIGNIIKNQEKYKDLREYMHKK